MGELYNLSFSGGDKGSIVVTRYDAIWTYNQQRYEKHLKLSNYLLTKQFLF